MHHFLTMVAHEVTVTTKSREFVCRGSCRRIQSARDYKTGDLSKKRFLYNSDTSVSLMENFCEVFDTNRSTDEKVGWSNRRSACEC